MSKIRVLVVDDSVVIRRVISDELNRDDAIEVIGVAANGIIALAKMKQLTPDIVILDVEMPDMDGLEALSAIRKDYPRLPVIMFSTLTERGASATLDALALGASDYFTKPTATTGGLEESKRIIREELVPAIKQLCSPKSHSAAASTLAATASSTTLSGGVKLPGSSSKSAKIDIVAFGTSTGGPNALAEIFGALPRGLTVPILIVQHMPPMFTRLLAERLTAHSHIPVEEGTPGTILQPGRAYIAPGDYHMSIVKDVLHTRLVIRQDPPENSCRPAVDPLFRSVARVYGANTLAVVLTGMGQDGLRGCEAIRESHGQIIVQDEASSVVWGMPGFVARAGLADRILPLSHIATEIVRRLGGASA